MSTSILHSVPTWVFGLFALLVWLGVRQSMPQSMTLRRTTVVPIALLAASLSGVLTSFGTVPLALLAWLASVAAAAVLVAGSGRMGGVRYEASARRFHLPGSWMPLTLMMGMFAAKFVAGACLATQPALAASVPFAVTMSAVFGLFSGTFLGRAWVLWSLARSAGTLAVVAAV